MERRRERPLRIIVIDPRITKVAEIADIHLRLRPGTDTALALGWANVIINEDLYDKDFFKKWTIGFDALVERLKEYTPEKVAGITGLTETEIIESARMYANNKP